MDLRAALTAYGLTDKTTQPDGDALTIPAALALTSGGSPYVYIGDAAVTYKATQGKIGKARK